MRGGAHTGLLWPLPCVTNGQYTSEPSNHAADLLSLCRLDGGATMLEHNVAGLLQVVPALPFLTPVSCFAPSVS